MKGFAEKRIHWLGHDTFKISGKKTLFIDPYKIVKKEHADIIFVTHEHFDHCSPDDIKLLAGEKTILVGTEDSLAKVSGNKKIVKAGDTFTIDDVAVEVVPAYNADKKFHPKQNGWVGYILTIDGCRVYHAGDTDFIPEMKNVKADIALLPVSGTYVMTAEEAVQAALVIKPKVAIPMHYGSVVGAADDAERFKKGLAGKIEVLIKHLE